MHTTAKPSRGFTLVEIIVSIVALGILMTLITAVFAPQVVHGTDPLYSMRATELGQSYLEEILGKRFDENSPLGNSQRCNSPSQPACSITMGIDAGESAPVGVTNIFDDVDDYNSLTQTLNAQPHDQSGNVRSGYEDFHVWITVVYAGSEIGLPNNTDAKRIDVTIIDPRSNQYLFTAYKTNF